MKGSASTSELDKQAPLYLEQGTVLLKRFPLKKQQLVWLLEL